MRRRSRSTFSVGRIRLSSALTIGVLILLSWPATAAGTGVWIQQSPVGVPGSIWLEHLQCPTVSVCFAVGEAIGVSGAGQTQSILEKTVDGGATWTSEELSISTDARTSTGLACPSMRVCYLLPAVSDQPVPVPVTILATTDGGITWTEHQTGTEGTPDKLSCPADTVCYVTVSHNSARTLDLLVTTDAGTSWHSYPIPVTTAALNVLTCPGVADCYLSGLLIDAGSGPPGGLAETHDGGRTWAVAGAPRGYYASMACPSINHCYTWQDNDGARGALLVTEDGGGNWTPLPATGNFNGGRIICPREAACYVLADTIWRTTDGGATWSAAFGGERLTVSDGSCPSVTICYAMNRQGLILKTTDGTTWQEPTPYSRRTLTAITCPSPIVCYAVGEHGTVVTTTDGGANWIRHSTGSSALFVSIACPTVNVCLTAGTVPGPASTAQFVLLRTTDSGQTWAQETSVEALSVTCPTHTFCAAPGRLTSASNPQGPFGLLRSTDAGQTWRFQAVSTTYPLSAVACPEPRRCIGVGGGSPCLEDDTCQRGWLFTTADGGRHWARQYNGTEVPVAVACTTPTQCYAGGYGVWMRATFKNGRWRVRDAGALPNESVQSLSCMAPSTCWALGLQLNSSGGVPVRTTNGGRSWQTVGENVPTPAVGGPPGGLQALTCSKDNRCFAVGFGGLIMAHSLTSR